MRAHTGHNDVSGESPLSDREREIVRLVALGLLNPEIAERLGISPATVHNHLDHIYKKLGVHGRVRLVLWFASHQADLPASENEPFGP